MVVGVKSYLYARDGDFTFIVLVKMSAMSTTNHWAIELATFTDKRINPFGVIIMIFHRPQSTVFPLSLHGPFDNVIRIFPTTCDSTNPENNDRQKQNQPLFIK